MELSTHIRPDTCVLIPAAGPVRDGTLSNISCSAMVPVGGRPVIYWTIRYLLSLGLREYIIAVPKRGLFVEEFVECTFGQQCDVSFIVPTQDMGLGGTVHELSEHADTQSALVVLGDTHFQFADADSVLSSDEPNVLVHPVGDSYRWCTVETTDSGHIETLYDKQPGLEGVDALIGVYYFPHLSQLQTASANAVQAARAKRRPAEMADILALIHAETPIRSVQSGDWLDCGNPDKQASSHSALLQKREFNQLEIDSVFGTITKRSSYVEKFLDEINYYRLLPENLAVLFPRVAGCSADWDDPWLKMEYYGYPTLSEIFVFQNVDPDIWEQIFIHLRDILLKGFLKARRPVEPDDLRKMYLEKTRQRLAGIDQPNELLNLINEQDTITINGQVVANLPRLWDRISSEVEQLTDNVQGCVIHGDLCFSNILYDLRARVCKLVDPRGQFGAAGIYGDLRYDVAKLYHSVYGLYDFIVNDLFSVSIRGNNVELQIHDRLYHREIEQRFERVFFAEFDRREILLITGLLFASMPALHCDAPRRQITMYARALQLFAELFDDPIPNQKAESKGLTNFPSVVPSPSLGKR